LLYQKISDCLRKKTWQRAVLISNLYLPMPLRVRYKKLKKDRNFIIQVKKKHTLKTQAAVNAKIPEILALNFAKGMRHDFRIFKESRLKTAEKITVRADSGYLGSWY